MTRIDNSRIIHAAKGTEIVGKTLEKASSQMKKFSQKLKNK